MQNERAGRRADAALLFIILLAAAAVGLLWLYSVPFHKAPDEGAHYMVVRFIRDHGRLPLFRPDELWLIRTPTGVIETYATFPPLAYVMSAVVGWLMHDGSMWPARFVSCVVRLVPRHRRSYLLDRAAGLSASPLGCGVWCPRRGAATAVRVYRGVREQ
jgi:hypothetical protein